MDITVTDVVAVLGLISGVTGTVLGILNYLRDRAAVDVSLQWDLTVTPGTQYDPDKKWGVITVTNTGRRSIFISHAAIRLPKAAGGGHLVVMEGVTGKTLPEGSPSERYLVSQDGLEEHAPHWRAMVAQVSDSRGKVWVSQRVKKQPSWAGGGEQNAA